MLTLVLGGARSGKSRFAQSLCNPGSRVVFVATARGDDDDEMRVRIAHHQRARPKHWCTIEEPLALAGVVETHSADFDVVLIDCLTLWLSNLCWEHRDQSEDVLRTAVSQEAGRLIASASVTNVIVVSNEVGYGLVPESPVGRLFRDLQGWLNQDFACAADYVYQVVAGIPIPIKRPEAKP
jgi:adenosylcobinamide kinase/adenosylcobinamide-phosphate guanylyltransferase